MEERQISQPLASPGWPGESRAAWVGAVAVALLLAFAAQGSRGVWEPDEGFYANAAASMVASGDWWVPRVNGEPFLDKPPLTYWGMAAGIALFGRNEWSLRASHALWFVATCLVVGLLAGRLWGPAAGPVATAAYAAMLAPCVAANVLTPDTVLTFWVAAMVYAYWRSQTAGASATGLAWMLGAGAAAGFGLLAKGPALVVFAFPVGVHLLVARGWRALLGREVLLGAGVALALGGSWYLALARSLPGAAAYFFDNQVAGRLWSDHYQRNPSWIGPLVVYLPMLLIGGLPWSLLWPQWIRSVTRDGPGAAWQRLRSSPQALLVLLWTGLPLLVLGLARSRLPLYALPVMPALALAAAVGLTRAVPARTPARRFYRLAVPAVWGLLMVAAKVTAASTPSDHDSGRLAADLRRLEISPSVRVAAVDTKRNGLGFYGYNHLAWTRLTNKPYPFFSPPETLGDELARPSASAHREVFLIDKARTGELLERLASVRSGCRLLDRVDGLGVILCGRPFVPPSVLARRELSPGPGEIPGEW